jgi:hypothetical protein
VKKIRMDIDVLLVQSFETHAPSGAGTVIAAEDSTTVAPTQPNCSEIDGCPSAFTCGELGDL